MQKQLKGAYRNKFANNANEEKYKSTHNMGKEINHDQTRSSIIKLIGCIHTSFILSSSLKRSGRTASEASFSLLQKRSQ